MLMIFPFVLHVVKGVLIRSLTIPVICGIPLNSDRRIGWWAHQGSNLGPTGYEPVALPAELWALLYSKFKIQTPNTNDTHW
jgi:hypothetical protein